MKCPKCQFENPAGAKFCNECGHSLSHAAEATAPVLSFDEKLEKIQRYLPTGLTDKILSQKDRIEGERRQVTVMFCDIAGYSPMVERLGSERSYQIMDDIYEILIHKVHEFEGTVNEMTGDGIMALFGAPIAMEEAPQRALSSALSIQRDITKFNDRHKAVEPIQMRIGIHTGPVVVGTLGNDLRVEFKAVGDTVNLASRMEELADAGSTFVTEATYKLTKGLFRFQSIGKKTVKGKGKAIPVYKALSGKEEVYRPRLGAERMIYAEMVGRDQDLNKLELQVMKAINGQGSIVNIIGEAGIGKSRLVAELKKCEVMKKVALFEGRAISIGENLSFHPIIDIFKQWAQIKEYDGEAMALGKLEATVSHLFPEKFGEVLPFVATLMGMKLSGRYAERVKGIEGEALESLILKNVRELIIKASEQTPLVIVIEDMHWADKSSIDLIESLLRLTETYRILFITVFRPRYGQTGDRIADVIQKRRPVYSVEIVLEPLDAGLSEALINNMLKTSGIQHTVIRQIVHRAGGNPFFIEEVVRSFIDEGVVVVKSGSFKVTEKIHNVSIPHTINDVIMARIDRLEEETRDLVKVAAVIGRNFFLRVLEDVVGTTNDINSRLSYLKEIQLFRERKRMGEVEYIFKHALAQEVTYESILPLKCKKLHLEVAQSIEKVFSDRIHEFYGMLAYHYSRAENLAKAEEFLIKAGEEALKSSASNEALHYYQEALGLYLKKHGDEADPEKIAMMEKNIALALYNRGLYAESIEHFNKALNYYWGKLPRNAISAIGPLLSSFVHLLLALYLPSLKFRKIPTERDTEVIDLFHKKCKALAVTDPIKFFFEFLYLFKGATNFKLTEFDLGNEIFMDASALFSFSGLSFRLSRKILDSAKEISRKANVKILMNRDFLETIHNYFSGHWKEIKAFDDDLADENLSLGEIWGASQNLYWHGLPSIYQGSIDKANYSINRLNDIIEEYENDFSLILKFELDTNLLLERRDLQNALLAIEKAIELANKAGFAIYLFDMYSYKVWIHILMGDIEKAKKNLMHANEIRAEVNAVPIELSNFCRSQLEYHLYRLKESIKSGNSSALSKYRKDAYKSSKMLIKVSKKAAQHRTEAYKLMGVYYWLINKQKKALKSWQKAIEEGEGLGAQLELSRTYFEIGKRLLEGGSKYKILNGLKAETYLEKANALFREMDLQWDLDELDRLVRS